MAYKALFVAIASGGVGVQDASAFLLRSLDIPANVVSDAKSKNVTLNATVQSLPSSSGTVSLKNHRATVARHKSNQTYRPPEVGATRCIYYSSYEGDYITKVSAYAGPSPKQSAPTDPQHSDLYMPPRGNCWLILDKGSSSMTQQDRYSLRIAELAVCGMYTTKPASCDPFCQVDMRVPLAYNSDDRNDISSCIAMAAYSRLENQNVNLNDVAMIGGLQVADNAVTLSTFTSVAGVLDQKLDYAYTKSYSTVLIPKVDTNTYWETAYGQNEQNPDPLFLDHEFNVVPCATLAEVAAHAFA